MSKYILNVLQNIKIHCVFIYSFGSLQTLSNTHCLLSVHDLNLSPLLDSAKRSPAISDTTVRSKQSLLRTPILGFISYDMFVTTQILVMETDQFPETWVFERFKAMKFSRADSRIRM